MCCDEQPKRGCAGAGIGGAADGSLCGAAAIMITQSLCTYIFLSGINRYLLTFKKYLLLFRQVLNQHRATLPAGAGKL